MNEPMSSEELQACRERAEAATGLSPSDVRGGAFTWDGDEALLADVVTTADALAALRADVPRLLATVAATVVRAESAELGCEIAYRREPTQAEGDAHEHRHEQSMGPAHGSGECFVPMGGWTGRRCRICSRWVWGGPTACAVCVALAERDENEIRR